MTSIYQRCQNRFQAKNPNKNGVNRFQHKWRFFWVNFPIRIKILYVIPWIIQYFHLFYCSLCPCLIGDRFHENMTYKPCTAINKVEQRWQSSLMKKEETSYAIPTCTFFQVVWTKLDTFYFQIFCLKKKGEETPYTMPKYPHFLTWHILFPNIILRKRKSADQR